MMIKVKVLREHGNSFGDKYEKKVGQVYAIDDITVIALAERGYVEQVKPKKKGK